MTSYISTQESFKLNSQVGYTPLALPSAPPPAISSPRTSCFFVSSPRHLPQISQICLPPGDSLHRHNSRHLEHEQLYAPLCVYAAKYSICTVRWQVQANTRNLEDVFRANERSSSSLEIMQVRLPIPKVLYLSWVHNAYQSRRRSSC